MCGMSNRCECETLYREAMKRNWVESPQEIKFQKTTEIMGKRTVDRRVATTRRLRAFDASVTLGLIMFEFYLL